MEAPSSNRGSSTSPSTSTSTVGASSSDSNSLGSYPVDFSLVDFLPLRSSGSYQEGPSFPNNHDEFLCSVDAGPHDWDIDIHSLVPHIREQSNLKPKEFFRSLRAVELFEDFPVEIQAAIANFLPIEDVGLSSLISKRYHAAAIEKLITVFNEQSEILKDERLIRKWAEEIQKYPLVKNLLLRILIDSKTNVDLGNAPAVAITLLNAAGMSFAGRDLSGVRIAGAVLDYAMLDGTNLENTDLRGVSLIYACLANTNFARSNLENVQCDGDGPCNWMFLRLNPKESCYSFEGKIGASKANNIQQLHFESDTYFDNRTHRSIENLHNGYKIARHNYQCCFNEDLFVRSTDKGIIEVWDLKNKRCLHTFPRISGKKNPFCAAVNPSGTLLASNESPNFISIRDLKTGALLSRLPGHSSVEGMCGTFNLAFSADGNFLISGGLDCHVRVWDLKSRKCLVARKHDWYVSCSVIDTHTKKVYSTDDCKIRIGNNPIDILGEYTSDQHQDDISCLAISNDGKCLVSGGLDKTVRVWDLNSRKCRVLVGHKGVIVSVAISANQQFVASCGQDNIVRVWNLNTWECTQAIELNFFTKPFGLKFSNDGRYLMHHADNRLWRWRFTDIDGSLQLHSIYCPQGNDKPRFFTADGANIEGVENLSEANFRILQLDGARGTPASIDRVDRISCIPERIFQPGDEETVERESLPASPPSPLLRKRKEPSSPS